LLRRVEEESQTRTQPPLARSYSSCGLRDGLHATGFSAIITESLDGCATCFPGTNFVSVGPVVRCAYSGRVRLVNVHDQLPPATTAPIKNDTVAPLRGTGAVSPIGGARGHRLKAAQLFPAAPADRRRRGRRGASAASHSRGGLRRPRIVLRATRLDAGVHAGVSCPNDFRLRATSPKVAPIFTCAQTERSEVSTRIRTPVRPSTIAESGTGA